MPKKRVLILGAMSDIAQALARDYAAHGHDVVLACRDADRLSPLADELRAQCNVAASCVEFDALDYASHAAFYNGLSPAVDVAVCVFGYLGDAERARTDFDEARRILEVNYLGAVSILDVVASDFERRGRGTLIGIGSVAGDRGRQSNYHYGSAKAAFAAYLSGLRNRLVPAGVHVMTVKPGFVRTRMTADLALPERLTATPQQVAADIRRADERGVNVLYTRWFWRFIMLVICSIPEPLFKRLKL